MKKLVQRMFIPLCAVFAFLCAGFFFGGCGVDYSKISVVADDTSVVEIDVGESVDLTFSIKNYKSGFSNKVKINQITNGGTDIFSCESPVYLSESRFKVKVTGVAGGTGRLQVVTLEGNKECFVDISVKQFSTSMALDDQVFYVSNSTAFTPNSNMFLFDSNTTYKDLSYYYIDTDEIIDFSTCYLKELSYDAIKPVAEFYDGVQSIFVDIKKFDSAELRKEGAVDSLYLINDGEEEKIDVYDSSFDFFAVYDHSITQDGKVNEDEDYENIVYALSDVNILPDLNVNVKAAYLGSDGYANGSDLTDGDEEFDVLDASNIRIVPNNSTLKNYLLKIEVGGYTDGAPIEISKIQSNNHVDVDFFEYTPRGAAEPDSSENVFYVKISQNVQTQAQTNVGFRIFYNIAQDINDASVNVELDYVVNVEIAPIGILVNGTSEPDIATLYNYYNFPEFGWNELLFDVISGLESSPNFSGIYFTFDGGYLEVLYDGVNVLNDVDNASGKLYTDLTKSFFIRGAYGCDVPEDVKYLQVHLVSDILEGKDEIVLDIPFEIVAGATSIAIDDDYSGYNKSFYLDINAGEQVFDDVLFANAEFQGMIYEFEGGVDSVNIALDQSNPYTIDGTAYFLNLTVSPRAEGLGLYSIYLDNGMVIQVTFNVIRTLTTEKDPFALSAEGNEMVTGFTYQKSVNAGGIESDYNNVLYINLLNQNQNGVVKYGSSVTLDVVANVSNDGVSFEIKEGTMSKMQIGSAHRFTTTKNELIEIEAKTKGHKVEKFARVSQEFLYNVYISSYSLVQEFNLRDKFGNLALSNKVYYGQNTIENDKSVAFTPYVDSEDAFGFYKYGFTNSAFVNAYNSLIKDGESEEFVYNVEESEIEYEYVDEVYDKKFVYFNLKYLRTSGGGKVDVGGSSISVEITKQGNAKKVVKLNISSGLMFYAEDFKFTVDGVEYTVVFPELKYQTIVGDFDLAALSYRNKFTTGYTLECSAYLRQRNSTKHYDIEIDALQFESVESISLASSVTKLDFSNETLVYNLGVYTYPQTSTNKSIIVEYVSTNGNPYTILNYTIDESEKESGIYTVTLSCEDFFRTLGDQIVTLEDSLTGKVYIYPSEWGSSYSSINLNYQPIEIDVQYRNGSKNNPYLIETAQDVVEINSNTTTLSSHYEINAVIDMSSITEFVPIGIINGMEPGFSGSIVGTNSQASIVNINVSSNNYTAMAGGEQFFGLFGKITDGALIENISFSGKFDIDVSPTATNAFVGLVAGVNKGLLSNVAVTIEKSNINSTKNLYFGGVAGINVGQIIQNLDKYDDETDVDGNYIYRGYLKDGDGKLIDENGEKLAPTRILVGQQTKILSYFNDFVTITVDNCKSYIGGIAGASSGTIKRILSEDNTLKFYGYSAYSAYTQIKVDGNLNSGCYTHAGGAVGIASYGTNTAGTLDRIIPEGDVFVGLVLKNRNIIANLLVGGEISTKSLNLIHETETADYVGGIVGYVDTLGTGYIEVYANVSRTFLRAQKYVGAIVGFDVYSTSYGVDKTSHYFYQEAYDGDEDYKGLTNEYKNIKNKVEAVDDGRNSFYASMIIKTKEINVSESEESRRSATYAVGNAHETSGALFWTDPDDMATTCVFDYVSYLDRNKIEGLGTGDVIYDNLTSTVDYYGDYLIVLPNDNKYDFVYQHFFVTKQVEIGLDEGYDQYRMKNNAGGDLFVYFMYYFSVDGYLNTDGAFAQEDIEDLNTISANSSLYPYQLSSSDVKVSSANSDILSIDVYGNFTVKGTGLAVIDLTSVKNTNKNQTIYVYIVNFFDKDIDASLFYTTRSSSGLNVTDNSTSNVHGGLNTNIYLVPTYGLRFEQGSKNFYISDSGVLKYKNVDYVLTKNSQLTVETEPKVLPSDYFSTVKVNKQTVIFYRVKETDDGDVDQYNLTPVLVVSFGIKNANGEIETVKYVYELTASSVDLNVRYRKTASQIYTQSGSVLLKANGIAGDKVTIVSENPNEKLFYQIFYKDEEGNNILVQDRLPEAIGEIDDSNWDNYINFEGAWATNNDKYKFLNMQIKENGDNTFDFVVDVNLNSERFLNRENENIFGEYTVYFYASDLGQSDGVSCAFKINLEEAEVTSVSMNNYSNINDIAVSDKRLVPSQRGLLEVSIDPVEATFDTFTISNSMLNYRDGATEASLVFAYEMVTEEGVEYRTDPYFGTYKNGVLTFTYAELKERIDYINQSYRKEHPGYTQDVVSYAGKVYVSYFMPSTNVDDSVSVGFDVDVVYSGDKVMSSTIKLQTKLNSYAKLKFDDKPAFGDVYYVARGLSYTLSLDAYGFNESQIKVSTSNSVMANLTKIGIGKYSLDVTSNSIAYNNEIGYKIEIVTEASKVVDNVTIFSKDTITVYIMEFVVDYLYVEGINEDVVKGMEDGIIYTAVGNPYKLEFDIRKFLEYDETNSAIRQEVDNFVASMTENITWSVYFNDVKTDLKQGYSFREDYYSINGLTVTPLLVYSAESDIYYFSASANYTMKNGVYIYNKVGEYKVYTEFEFEVHNQSTEDSPIPIYTYEEFIGMQENEWYILLKDIVLPSADYASIGQEQFKPITENIKGFDGNNHKLIIEGNYNFTGLGKVGVFESISDGVILKNVTIELASNAVFKVDQTTFDIGLLAAENNGIITNCSIEAHQGSALSVSSSVSSTNAYVAPLVAKNNGYITHSRTSISVYSNVNLSGFVGVNNTNGVIASSYFKGASLRNQTNTATEFTAGLAIENHGKIYTSYVSGTPDGNLSYYDQNENTILSSNNISGFVYKNSGQIQDSYSNIRLKQSGAFASGFVFENSGEIERCFSTSVFESNQSSNYGFVRANYLIGQDTQEDGIIKRCFFLQDKDEELNLSIGKVELNENTDINALNINGFADVETNFYDFVYANGRDTNSVWFFNDGTQAVDSNFKGEVFNTGRLELVAPNIIASSSRMLDSVENVVDAETGATYTKYVYIYETNAEPLGSMYNPILISDAEMMEEYILQENNKLGYNYSYYRLISDIDYEGYIYNSKLYTTKFMGYIEGNFMTISGISLVSSAALESAGLFAEIGNSSLVNAVGTVMNFTIMPDTVSFVNANAVGALAGKVNGGKVLNIRAEIQSGNQMVVTAKNIAGGAIGLAIGNYKIQNLYSQFSAKARNQEISILDGDIPNTYVEGAVELSKYSFAGSSVGILSGRGTFINGLVDTTVSALADKAGLMFGLVDGSATAKRLKVMVSPDMMINGYSYGGLLVGETKGNIRDIEIVSAEEGAIFTNFKKSPTVSTAVGGVAGLVTGGSISDVVMKQSIQLNDTSTSVGIEGLGGLFGEIAKPANISNVTVDASLTGLRYVGGIAGIVSASGTATFEDVYVKTQLNALGLKMKDVGLGGIAGYVQESALISLKTSKENESITSWDDIKDAKAELVKMEDEGKSQAEIDEQEEVIALLISNHIEYQNEVYVTVSTDVGSYSSDLKVYVGPVYGLNENKLPHTIKDTAMTIEGVCSTNDFGNTYAIETTAITCDYAGATVSVLAIGAGGTENVAAIVENGTRCFVDCNLTVNFANKTEGNKAVITATLYGDVAEMIGKEGE